MGAIPPALFNFIAMTIEEIASAVVNDTYSGLSGLKNANISISLEQTEDEVVALRETLINNYWKKGILQKDDLLMALNCVVVDCKDPTKCGPCGKSYSGPAGHSELHFEIPKLVGGIGEDALAFVGSADRQVRYNVYYNPSQLKYHQYKLFGKNKPYVYIEKTPNENGNYDGWIFNLPFVKSISVIGIFKDPRDLEKLGCDGNCDNTNGDLGSISYEVKEQLTKTKLYYYRNFWARPTPNDQVAR